MSTRALYTFYPGEDGWPKAPIHVYKHHDGYPTGAADAIIAALEFAWPLPRYEHDEFAAAFVAANKSHWIAEELRLLRKLETESEDHERSALREQIGRVRNYGTNGNGGGVRLCEGGDFEDVAPYDIEYWYTISPKKTKGVTQLIVTAYDVAHSEGEKSAWSISKLFTAPLKSGDTLKAKAKKHH